MCFIPFKSAWDKPLTVRLVHSVMYAGVAALQSPSTVKNPAFLSAWLQQKNPVSFLMRVSKFHHVNRTVHNHEAIRNLELDAQKVSRLLELHLDAEAVVRHPASCPALVAMKAFDIPELLERVLLNLELTAMIRVERVCAAF